MSLRALAEEVSVLERLTITDFTPCVGQPYGLALGERSVVMRLRDARSIGAAPLGDASRTPFSLEFETEGPDHVAQGTYAVTFPDGTCTPIFIVPIRATPSGGTRLEAIFT